MARLIRTEYIEGLQKILAYEDTRVVSDETLENLRETIVAIGNEHIDAVAQEFPPKASMTLSFYTNVDWKTPSEVRDEAYIWGRMYREVLTERDCRRRTARTHVSFERLREHARVQLAWANDLDTATVNLNEADLHRFESALEFVTEVEESQS